MGGGVAGIYMVRKEAGVQATNRAETVAKSA